MDGSRISARRPSQYNPGMDRSNFPRIAIFSAAWRYLLLVAWGFWWGGLCFYAVVVVPIGTKTIGTVEQGFITQRVTWWHNVITGVFLVCVAAEAYRRRGRMLLLTVVALALVEIALIGWHSRLTGMMDLQNQTVPSHFYREHAVYLWITAAEWGFGLLLPVWLFPAGD